MHDTTARGKDGHPLGLCLGQCEREVFSHVWNRRSKEAIKQNAKKVWKDAEKLLYGRFDSPGCKSGAEVVNLRKRNKDASEARNKKNIDVSCMPFNN